MTTKQRTETVNYKGIDFDVSFYYSPAERMVMYYNDGSGYPGTPAEVHDIIDISYCGADFMDILERDLEDIKERLIQIIED